MTYDFHTHTFLSDGELSPLELARRAIAQGYLALAITDHVNPGQIPRVVPELVRDCAIAQKHWHIPVLPGVELTHLPPDAIADAAQEAKTLGAALVVVHGETIVEPVPPGTNHAALECPAVDILAHPGLITLEDARLASQHHIFLELSARRGHSLTNGHVARLAQTAGARLLLSSDAHAPGDLLTPQLARAIVRGAGLEDDQQVLSASPAILLEKLRKIRA